MLPEAGCIECKVSGVMEGGREGARKKGWCDGRSQD